MGFPVWTSNITGSNFGSFGCKTKYIIFGEEIEVEGHKDGTVAIMVSSINIMGKPFYDDIKRQGITLPKEIEDFLEKKFIVLERDRKIDIIIS